MGCDIHFFVEYRRAGDRKWTPDQNHRIFIGVDRKTGHPFDDEEPRLGDLGTHYQAVTSTIDGVTRLTYSFNSDDPNLIDKDVPRIGRDYLLFGFLADVRSSAGSALYEPRGIPDDVSEPIKDYYNYWSCDAHTPSYLSLDEFKKVIKEYRKAAIADARYNHEDSSWAKSAYQSVIDYIEKNRKALEHQCEEGLFDMEAEARVVFWFDN